MNEIINILLQSLIVATKAQQEDAMKSAAGRLADWVKASETTIDDSLVKQVVIPNLDVFVAEFKAKMA